MATPARACGSSTLNGESPNKRADNAIGHNPSGGLSTVIALPASREPKKNAFHDWAPACAAAA